MKVKLAGTSNSKLKTRGCKENIKFQLVLKMQ